MKEKNSLSNCIKLSLQSSKIQYEPPKIEILEITVEKGFAASGSITTPLSPDTW